jgi:predicted GNAT family acetyltransferase
MDRQYEVVDEKDRQRFTVTEGGSVAELVYRDEGGRLVLVHTGVPDELGGRGIAAALVRHAVEAASTRGQSVAPWCPYARHWQEQHPDVAATVEVDWAPPPETH